MGRRSRINVCDDMEMCGGWVNIQSLSIEQIESNELRKIEKFHFSGVGSAF